MTLDSRRRATRASKRPAMMEPARSFRPSRTPVYEAAVAQASRPASAVLPAPADGGPRYSW